LEQLAGQGEGLAEGVDEAGADVALTVWQVLASKILSTTSRGRDPSRIVSYL
jgi:hypothetical protein